MMSTWAAVASRLSEHKVIHKQAPTATFFPYPQLHDELNTERIKKGLAAQIVHRSRHTYAMGIEIPSTQLCAIIAVGRDACCAETSPS